MAKKDLSVGKPRLEQLRIERQGYQTAKTSFNDQYSALSQYFYQIKDGYQIYTPQIQQGQFQNDGNINDNEGFKSAKAMASALMGMVWKNKSGTFRLVSSKNIPESRAVKGYFQAINTFLTAFMERSKSRFETSLFKAILEMVIYGTSGLVVQDGGYRDPLKYFQKSVLSFYLGYDKEGEIREVFIDYNFSAAELWDRYGTRAGGEVKAAVDANDHNRRFIVTEAIKPRDNVRAGAGKLSMPYSSELFMPDQNVFLEEGGYESIPLKVLFQDKLEYEAYGRSSAMDALPTVVQINICTEILAIGGELTAQPALGMYDNGSLAGLAVDLSAGALNVFNVAGTVPTEKPIFPLYEIGDLRVMYEWMMVLKEQIGNYFLLDKLYDLNAKQRMTLGEAVMRDQIRSDALTPVFTNILAFLSDVIERSVDICYGKGLFGVANPENVDDPKVEMLLKNGYQPFQIPDEVMQAMVSGLDWYDIEYINPASRIMNNEELQSTLKFIQVLGEAGAISQDFIDVIDPDGTAEKLKELTATDSVVTRTLDERKKIRDQRNQFQMEMAKIEAQKEMAIAKQANAQANAAQSQAISNMQNIGGAGGQ